MNRKEHKERHGMLHSRLDELIADYIQNPKTKKSLSKTTLVEFLEWSSIQAEEPDHEV